MFIMDSYGTDYFLTQSSEHDSELNMLLSVTDLLATCAEGENAFIDSVCQNIYELDKILK